MRIMEKRMEATVGGSGFRVKVLNLDYPYG